MFTSGANKKQSAIRGSSGQIATVILLIMGVVLVVVLSLISRTTKEIEIAGQQQDSARVFNAAETGVEQALSNSGNFVGGDVTPQTVTNTPVDIAAKYEVTAQSGLETTISMGSSATVYLEGNGGNNVNIKWAKRTEGCEQRASLLLSVYYEESGITHSYYEAIKPRCTSYTNKAEGFTVTPQNELTSGEYGQEYVLSLPTLASGGTYKLARIKALYAETDVLVSGVSPQAYDIRSEATGAANSGIGEKSAIKVTRTKPAPPLVLDYAVYSGGSLIK